MSLLAADDVAKERRPTRYAEGGTRTNAVLGMQHAASAAIKAGCSRYMAGDVRGRARWLKNAGGLVLVRWRRFGAKSRCKRAVSNDEEQRGLNIQGWP